MSPTFQVNDAVGVSIVAVGALAALAVTVTWSKVSVPSTALL